MKNNKVYIILSVTLLLIFSICDAYALFDNAKVTLIVEDEYGAPLEGVEVGVGFEKNTGWSTETKSQRGVSDVDGRFTATGRCNGHIGYGGSKNGYYRSHYEYNFKGTSGFGWEPWNPELKIVMRKIENPVPMYAKYAGMSKKIEIPEVNKDIGFDLIRCDWVAPYGNGNFSDFIFNLKKSYINNNSFSSELTVKFTNNNDGILNVKEGVYEGSIFKLPRYAPIFGYENIIVFSKNIHSGSIKMNFNDNDSYIFRVRSSVLVSADNVKEIKALYGKLIGGILVTRTKSDNPILTFKYYLNPDWTRNLEFDTSNNLFGKLTIEEQVNEP